MLQMHTGIQPNTNNLLNQQTYPDERYSGGVSSLTGTQIYSSGGMGGTTSGTGGTQGYVTGNRMYPGTAYPKSAVVGSNTRINNTGYGNYGTGAGTQHYAGGAHQGCSAVGYDGQTYDTGVGDNMWLG